MQTSLGWEGRWLPGLGADKAQKSSPSPELSETQQISGEGLLFFFLIPKTFCLGLQLINNVVIVPVNSEEAQSYIYMYPFSPKPQGRVFLMEGSWGL